MVIVECGQEEPLEEIIGMDSIVKDRAFSSPFFLFLILLLLFYT